MMKPLAEMSELELKALHFDQNEQLNVQLEIVDRMRQALATIRNQIEIKKSEAKSEEIK